MASRLKRRRRPRRTFRPGCLPYAILLILLAVAGLLIFQRQAEIFKQVGAPAQKPAGASKPGRAAAPEPADMRIVVRDNQTSETIPGAIVGIAARYAPADSTGEVFIDGLRAAGSVKAAARAPGYQVLRWDERVRPGRNEIDIRLERLGGAPSAPGPGPDEAAPAGPAYLTIDDGPSPRWTPQVLDILDERNVPATFFVIGWRAEKRPDLIRRIYVEGHTLGNHTYSHNYSALYGGPVSVYLESLRENADLLAEIVGFRPRLTRPPGGEAGNFRAGWRSAVGYAGYRTVLWNVSSGDGATETVSSQMVENVKTYLDRLPPGEAPIILTHDVRRPIIKALPRIIAEVRRRGYEFQAMSEPLR